MDDEEYYNEKINYYIEIGAIRIAGVDADGEYIFCL